MVYVACVIYIPEEQKAERDDCRPADIIVDITNSDVKQPLHRLVVAGASVRHSNRVHA